MDRIVIPFENKSLVNITGIVELSFMFFIFVIMTAGAGTLVEDMTGSTLVRIVFSFIFCALVTFVSLKGISSAVKIFGLAVPTIVIVAIILSVAIIFKSGNIEISTTDTAENPLIKNPAISMLNFVSYNFFCAIGTFAAIGQYVTSKRKAIIGSLFGGILLTAIALLIILAIFAKPGAEHSELPLLNLAGGIHISVKYIVAITLLVAMFGASLSVFVPIPLYLQNRKNCSKHSTFYTSLLSLAAALLSLFGFSNLIAVIYPIYGYLAFAAIIGLIINYIKNIKKQ